MISDRVRDLGVGVIDDECNRLDICSQEPTTFTEATVTYTLGNKTTPTIGVPEDGAVNGRRVIVAAITDGSVTGTGTATHYALVDTVNSRLLVTSPITPNQAVTNGNTFTSAAVSVTIPD